MQGASARLTRMRNLLRTFANRPVAFLLVGGFACLFLQAFLLPYTPIYQGDTIPIFLLEARRMLEGEVMYRDFFEFTLPGIQAVCLLLFQLFGVRAWISAAMLVVLGVSLAWLGAALSRQVLKGKLVLLPSLLFLPFAFSSELDPTHHWYSTLTVMAALALLIETRSLPRIVAAGALCGLATVFTQNRGAAAILGIAIFLLWESRAKGQGWRWLLKAQTGLCAGFVVVMAPLVVHLIWKVGLQRFLFCVVTFPIKYYPYYYWNTPQVYMAELPDYPFWLELPAVGVWISMHLLLPLIYLLFFVRYLREAKTHPAEPWDRLMLLSTVGMCLFLGIAFSPNWMRLCSVSLPALIVFTWFLRPSGRLSRAFLRFFWVAALLVLVAQPAIVQTGWKGYLDSPVGRVAFLDPARYEKFRWLSAQTRSGDFFFAADDAAAYFLLGLRNPAQVSFLTATPYTRPEQVQNVVEMLEKHRVRFVLWSAWLDVPQGITRGTDPLGPARAYLRTHYHPIRNFTDPELQQAWERNP